MCLQAETHQSYRSEKVHRVSALKALEDDVVKSKKDFISFTFLFVLNLFVLLGRNEARKRNGLNESIIGKLKCTLGT